MAESKFTPDNCQAFIELTYDGLSIADAAREIGVTEKTIRNWLSKGRGEESGPFRDFANAVDAAREEIAAKEEPMDHEELLLVTSRAARRGSVQAMKLLDEMLRRGEDPGSAEPEDPFEQLDGPVDLAEARKRRAAN